MRLEHIAVGIIIVLCLMTFLRHANRSAADKVRPSWAVRAINAAGGNVEATRLLPAMGELGERAVAAVAGRTRETVSARAGERRARRAEDREARSERAAEIGEKARDVAAKVGQKVVDAADRRWVERHGERTPITPGEDGDSPLQGRWDCTKCGTTVTGTIPASEQDVATACGKCGTRVTFYRAPNDPPDEPAQDEATTDPEASKPEAKPKWRLLRRFVWWRKPQTDDEQAPPTPENVPEQPQPAATTATSNGSTEEPMTTTNEQAAPTITTPGAPVPQDSRMLVPPPIDWQALSVRVADFNPDEDAELINFMTAEIAGMAAYSKAYEDLFQTCHGSLGLDPRSVQALGEFGERFVEITQEMARARARFVAFYEEVMKFVGDGGVMPHNGRFFSGNVPV